MSEDIVEKNFAEIYEREHGIVIQELDKFFPSFLDKMKWKPNEVILDHGCGIGRTCSTYIIPRIKKGTIIYGTDISKSMVKLAQENYAHPSVKYLEADLMSPDFELKDKKFDKIFSTFVMHVMLESHRDVLKKMYDLLVPGGYLITSDIVDSYHFEVRAYLKKTDAWADHSQKLAIPYWNPEKDYCPPPSFKKYSHEIREEAGFEILEIDHWPTSYDFENDERTAEFTLAHDPFAHETYLTPLKQHELEQEINDYINSGEVKRVVGKTADGKFRIKFGVITALARKPHHHVD